MMDPITAEALRRCDLAKSALQKAQAFAQNELACREGSYLPNPTADEQADIDEVCVVYEACCAALEVMG